MTQATAILALWNFNDYNTILLIAGLSVLVFILLSRLTFWRKEAGKAFYAAAKYAPSDEIHARYARRGVLAGNKENLWKSTVTLRDVQKHKHL